MPGLNETRRKFTPLNAIEEASRCLLCHDAPCADACPASTAPDKFIRSIRFKNLKGAIETIRTNNAFGACCAFVCPREKLCEEACARTGIDRPIDIGGLQAFAMDFEKESGMKVLESVPPVWEKVAVIGAGPAGLTAASSLALKGYDVTVFEARERAGGMLTYGIIPARLPRDVVDHEIGLIKERNVKIRLNTRVGKDISFEQIQKEYKAICIAAGLWRAVIPEEFAGISGVKSAMEFLAEAGRDDARIPDNITIIGGGDVAMDCAAAAKLSGAKNVTILYRRTIPEMPAGKSELAFARSLGVSIIPNFILTELVVENKKLTAVKATGVMWADRNTFSEDAVSAMRLRTELLIFAIGLEPEDFDFFGVSLDKNNIIITDDNSRTSAENIFAAGDAAYGGKTVVEAVAAGKRMAFSVDAYLTEKRIS